MESGTRCRLASHSRGKTRSLARRRSSSKNSLGKEIYYTFSLLRLRRKSNRIFIHIVALFCRFTCILAAMFFQRRSPPLLSSVGSFIMLLQMPCPFLSPLEASPAAKWHVTTLKQSTNDLHYSSDRYTAIAGYCQRIAYTAQREDPTALRRLD